MSRGNLFDDIIEFHRLAIDAIPVFIMWMFRRDIQLNVSSSLYILEAYKDLKLDWHYRISSWVYTEQLMQVRRRDLYVEYFDYTILPLYKQRLALVKEIRQTLAGSKKRKAKLIYSFMAKSYRRRKSAVSVIEAWYKSHIVRKREAIVCIQRWFLDLRKQRKYRHCSKDDECSICYERLLRNEKYFMPCGHFLCKKDMKKVVMGTPAPKCPLCKRDALLLQTFIINKPRKKPPQRSRR